jgi:NAD-dependent dihydropyrimidine dehydrogenase PreA subunit
MIASDCINCGACEPECPNNAISQGDPIFVIDPKLCTECVGFHDYEACAAVCPVDVCITDPNNIESEEALIARARELHPETDFGAAFQSRFRKEAGAAPAPAAAAVNGEAKAAAPAPVQAAVPPKPAATAAKPAPTAPAAKPAAPAPVKPAPRPKKTFPNELPNSFEEVSSQYQTGGALSQGGKLAAILLQPVLGALPHEAKKKIENAVGNPLFTAAGSTGLNIVHNMVLYPVICMIIAAVLNGPAVVFSQRINNYVLIGILLAIMDGVWRLRKGIWGLKGTDEMEFPASIYGAPLGVIAAPLLAKYGGMLRDLPIPVEGFYAKGFVDKLERERRYGNVYTLEDRGGAFLLKMEFPRWMPDIGVANRPKLPDELPDYDYDLALQDGQLVVRGKCTDEQVRKISSSVGAFPPEFTTVIPLQERVVGFAHHFANKVLQVVLLKDKGSHWRSRYR